MARSCAVIGSTDRQTGRQVNKQHPPWRVELQQHIGVGSVDRVLEVAVGQSDYRGRFVIGLLALAAIWVCSRRTRGALFVELTIRLKPYTPISCHSDCSSPNKSTFSNCTVRYNVL